jgi:hypothetical protein
MKRRRNERVVVVSCSPAFKNYSISSSHITQSSVGNDFFFSLQLFTNKKNFFFATFVSCFFFSKQQQHRHHLLFLIQSDSECVYTQFFLLQLKVKLLLYSVTISDSYSGVSLSHCLAPFLRRPSSWGFIYCYNNIGNFFFFFLYCHNILSPLLVSFVRACFMAIKYVNAQESGGGDGYD